MYKRFLSIIIRELLDLINGQKEKQVIEFGQENELKKRIPHGASNSHLNVFLHDDVSEFKNYMRMSPTMFNTTLENFFQKYKTMTLWWEKTFQPK